MEGWVRMSKTIYLLGNGVKISEVKISKAYSVSENLTLPKISRYTVYDSHYFYNKYQSTNRKFVCIYRRFMKFARVIEVNNQRQICTRDKVIPKHGNSIYMYTCNYSTLNCMYSGH